MYYRFQDRNTIYPLPRNGTLPDGSAVSNLFIYLQTLGDDADAIAAQMGFYPLDEAPMPIVEGMQRTAAQYTLQDNRILQSWEIISEESGDQRLAQLEDVVDELLTGREVP